MVYMVEGATPYQASFLGGVLVLSASEFQQLVSEAGWPNAFSDKSRANLVLIPIVGTGPLTHGVSVGAARTHSAPTQAVGQQHTRPHV
jgi:hypothetical protein